MIKRLFSKVFDSSQPQAQIQTRKRELKQEDKQTSLRPEATSHDDKTRDLLEDICSQVGNLDGMQCAICMDYIIACRTAVCGHSFCCECITESLLRKRECPHCRKDIRKWPLNSSELIDKAVELAVNSKALRGDATD